MAKISLESLTDIDGFIAAALVDSERALRLLLKAAIQFDLELLYSRQY